MGKMYQQSKGSPLTAIETYYNGNLFRARVEAKWAKMFDMIGLIYIYEIDRYKLPGTTNLPDFYLPQLDCFAECKPDFFGMYASQCCDAKLIHWYDEYEKWKYMSQSKPVLLFVGNPHRYAMPIMFRNELQTAVLLKDDDGFHFKIVDACHRDSRYMDDIRAACSFKFEYYGNGK